MRECGIPSLGPRLGCALIVADHVFHRLICAIGNRHRVTGFANIPPTPPNPCMMAVSLERTIVFQSITDPDTYVASWQASGLSLAGYCRVADRFQATRPC